MWNKCGDTFVDEKCLQVQKVQARTTKAKSTPAVKSRVLMETTMKIAKKGEEFSENEESESKTSGNAATSNSFLCSSVNVSKMSKTNRQTINQTKTWNKMVAIHWPISISMAVPRGL